MIDILSNESFLILLAIHVIAAIGMNLVYVTGQLNLGQAAFLAVGAYTTAVLEVEFGLDLWLALPMSALVAALVAVPVAIGANRVRGVYLIMGTLAAGEVVRVAISNIDSLGGIQGYSGQGPVSLFDTIVTLIVVLLAAIMVMASPFGLRMRAIFDDEDAAAAVGVNTRLIKISSVLISAATVAVAGGLLAKFLLFVAPRDFGVAVSFAIALYTLIGGVHSLAGAVVGAFAITYLLEVMRNIEDLGWVPPSLHWIDSWRLVIYGVLVIAVMWQLPEGIISRRFGIRLSRPFRSIRHRLGERSGSQGMVHPKPFSVNRAPASDEPILAARNIRHSFGGLMALDDASLEVYDRELLALIGANGAGKSTLIDVIAGRYACQEGDVVISGKSVRHTKAHHRTASGISRTFQALRPLEHLTVAESIRLGSFAGPSSRKASVDDILELFGLEHHKDQLPSELTLSAQRRVGIARAYASAPRVIFLDEPSAGLNLEERRELGVLIEELRQLGSSVVLVDHNLDLALGIADRVVVLDHGKVIAVGPPQEIIENPLVQEAYLGRRSGTDSLTWEREIQK